MKEVGVARACSIFGSDVKCKPERDHLEDTDIK
jgi:hypothetical protein